MPDKPDHIAKVITGMGPVSVDDHEALQARVYTIADKQQDILLEQAKMAGRLQSAEESIDRLRQSSATSEQLTASTTFMTLKLDHLLEKQQDMKKQIGGIAWRLAGWSIVGGGIAIGIALFGGWIAFTP